MDMIGRGQLLRCTGILATWRSRRWKWHFQSHGSVLSIHSCLRRLLLQGKQKEQTSRSEWFRDYRQWQVEPLKNLEGSWAARQGYRDGTSLVIWRPQTNSLLRSTKPWNTWLKLCTKSRFVASVLGLYQVKIWTRLTIVSSFGRISHFKGQWLSCQQHEKGQTTELWYESVPFFVCFLREASVKILLIFML